jgi:hypothetical protein
MNNLKKYAGLLNDAAPENHLLAYITPEERDMLVDAGGVKTPTPSGIFAYPPLGQPGTSPGTTTSGGSAFSGGSGGEMLENLMVLVVNINKQLHLLHQVFQ